MSTKTSIMYTKDHEHWYIDSAEDDVMTLIFSKDNARLVGNNGSAIIVEVEPDTDMYNKLWKLKYAGGLND